MPSFINYYFYYVHWKIVSKIGAARIQVQSNMGVSRRLLHSVLPHTTRAISPGRHCCFQYSGILIEFLLADSSLCFQDVCSRFRHQDSFNYVFTT